MTLSRGEGEKQKFSKVAVANVQGRRGRAPLGSVLTIRARDGKKNENLTNNNNNYKTPE